MSLLMKALEQATNDRAATRSEPAASGPSAPVGESNPDFSPTLELLPADTPSTRTAADARSKSRPPAGGEGSGSGREQNRAATATQAGRRAHAILDDLRRISPLVVFGALAALFAAGFAIYVYLQVHHPGVFVRQRPQPSTSPVVQSQPPAAPFPEPAPATLPAAISSSTVLPAPAPDVLPSPAPVAATPAPKPAPPPAPQTPAGTPENTIAVSGGTGTVAVNPALTEAYRALQAGNLPTAQRLYDQIASAEQRNLDALLGLASVAALQGRSDDATRYYQRILELDPRNALAQSGLIGQFGRGDPLAAETRLKQLIAREPSAFLFFTLGNLYADQSLWAQAQRAYFQAHHLEPGNPDYAYNLAVGLEHLSQPKLALEFYRRAAAIAAQRGRANFDAAQVKERISSLAAQMQ